jgi:hypothetical protein
MILFAKYPVQEIAQEEMIQTGICQQVPVPWLLLPNGFY